MGSVCEVTRGPPQSRGAAGGLGGAPRRARHLARMCVAGVCWRLLGSALAPAGAELSQVSHFDLSSHRLVSFCRDPLQWVTGNWRQKRGSWLQSSDALLEQCLLAGQAGRGRTSEGGKAPVPHA